MVHPLIATMIARSGRVWWQARYSSGKVISEWDTLTDKIKLPLGAGSTSRWEEAPKKGMVGLRLLCPNGMAGELESPEYRFFQLKAGGFNSAGASSGHYTDAHIIGMVEDIEGNCRCRAWDYHTKQLLDFRDNVYGMKYLNIGRLSLEVQGIRL